MVSCYLRYILLASALLAATGVNAADTPALTFSGALSLAENQSRLLEAGRLQAIALRETSIAAGQLPDPVLKIGLNNLPINGDDRFSLARDFMTMRSVGVMQEFTGQDKRSARKERLVREAESAEADRSLNLSNLRRGVALAWLDRYYQEQMQNLLAKQRTEIKLQIEAAEASYRSGRGTQSDVFAARLAMAQMDDRIAQEERLLVTTQTQLARWVGNAAGAPLANPPNTDAPTWSEAHWDAQLEHHPQIALMIKREEVAQTDVRLAQASKKPDWSVDLMFSQRGPAFSNMVSVNLSVPLQWDQKNRQSRELAARLATIEQLKAERDDALRAHAAEVRTMLQERQSHRDRLRRYDESILPLAAERTKAALSAYRGGTSLGGALTMVLEARRAEVDLQIERLRLEMDDARLWAQLNFLAAAGEK